MHNALPSHQATEAVVQKIVLATGNPGKLAEFKALLADIPLEIVAQGQLDIDDVQETASTFVENALLKARHAAGLSGLVALADDSGLCVPVLHGAPGVYSARYAGEHGNDTANNAKLLNDLSDFPDAQRNAYFICVLVVLRDAADPTPLIVEGRWHGRVLHQPRGTLGFGYDPLFIPDGYENTFGELDRAIKKQISHRAKALLALKNSGLLPSS